ncbi:MAG: copper transporter [Bacteroidetes bacterium GWF2_42_66]|nr:MAG: copper transporter [Bacteroidetes bacterium GWA2_42_15]OFX98494.1 MAG: copper transporter [Bacteroidetes bacterium GWE2_42_39]OFY42879.1 MAG: copper transporter [Bacteroidetes bacterium GWF2_42_66]HBL75324.1 copper transporter [Prolixibacteraceae bacterium]HCR91477.1 copper transporter [Prolixibacteraceae bacterium]
MSKENKFKEFFATSWAIDNRTSIYVLAVLISIIGLMNYYFIPKEQFPQIVIPYIVVNTAYPGTSPEDIENLVTRPIEKELKSISDVKKITSNSVPDFSSIIVEFDPDLSIETAKQRVRDAVDKAKSDLPNDLPSDPDIMDIDISEMPVMYLNISGNYDLNKLKHYAEIAQDKIEGLKEITRVDIVGALDREIQINADIFKMQAAKVTFSDIERAVAMENMTISGGSLTNKGIRNSVRIKGQFDDVEVIRNIVVQSSSGAFVKLADIADVSDSFEEQESFARLDGKNVITLNVIKKNGANLLDASDQIKDIVDNLKAREYPKDMEVTITGDQSRYTRNTLEELNNTIIIGFILVTIVLMFFMGFTNAFFVGLSVPLSIFVAYMVLPGLGYTMNMIVMFAFIFALGIVVDDAIVVIENTHRLHRFNPDIKVAAKKAAGEVFLPILSGTLTTLAPFFPLVFWPGIVGQFMHYLPVTLIITLFASLFVAYVFNPVFAVSFMKHEYDKDFQKGSGWKRIQTIVIVMLAFAGLFYLTKVNGLANFLVFGVLMIILFHFVIKKMINIFQEKIWPWLMSVYERQLRFILKGSRPILILGGMVALFFATIFITGIAKPTVLFFPNNDPNNIYVYIKMPGGTHQNVTDSITRLAEDRVYKAIGKNNPDVESIISNVTIGAEEEGFASAGTPFNKGRVSVNFVEHKFRTTGVSTTEYMEIIRKEVADIAGAEITVDKNQNGPPTGKPINIEITSENLENLIADAYAFRNYLDSLNIPGVEELKTDFEMNSPEIIIHIDRDRAQRSGISTGQIGMEIRTALYGKEISKLKQDEDEYPIMLRYDKVTRDNIDALVNLLITYRDMNTGLLRSIPLSTVARIDYTSSYAGIKRQDQKRIITVYSNVLSGHSANDIVPIITREAKSFPVHEGTSIKLTGEQEDQAETAAFFLKAMVIALGVIFFILITQFGSISKSLIILSEVIFSIIGVLLGVIIFNMDIVILMTGLGIVALGGIVVRNGILIVEFIDVKKKEGMPTRRAIIEGGKTRITPVILTATATMLGLVPLAVGMNINFETMFTELNPHIYFGGDNVAFWGPLSWSIIFGLSFATFLTLMFVPALYELDHVVRLKMAKRKNLKRIKELNAKK